MAVPNEFARVQALFASQPPALTTEGIGQFTERVAAALHATDRRWGHLRKYGAQSNYRGHAVNAILYLDDAPGQSVAVDICREHDSTITGPRWLVDPPRYSATDWYAPDAAPGPVPVPSATALGVSLFWAHAGTAKYLEQLRRNCDYAAGQIGATFARWFLTVGGDLFSGADPWRDAGAFFDRPDHEDVAHRTLALLKSFGLKSHLVLVGSRAQADTDAQRHAIVDRAVRVIRGHESEFVVVETHNEYAVNQSFSHDCRNMARRLKSQLPPGFPIALSSPNSVMGGNEPASGVLAEIAKMYGGDSGANVLTEHNTRPDPIWNPETLRRIGVTLPMLCGEPRGPGASAGGDVTDPAVLDADFATSQRGGAIGHVYHPVPGIWAGHCHPQWPNENRWANFADVPNAPAIAAALKARAQNATVPGPTPIPPAGPQRPTGTSQLLMGMSLLPEQSLVSPGGHAHLHYQSDGNLVVYLEGTAVWATHTAGHAAGSLQMQPDGNLVLYDATAAIRSTRTHGHPGAMVQLQDDGNFVVYDDPHGPAAGTPLWASAAQEFFS